MTFKSQAHRRKMHELAAAGKIKTDTLAKWEKATPNKTELPKRLTPKKPAAKK